MAKRKRTYDWIIIDCPDDPKAVCAEACDGTFTQATSRAKDGARLQKITTVLLGNFGHGWQTFGQWTGRKAKEDTETPKT